ncbi:ATP-binding protein [Ramlibacter sp. B156]|uniref:ATP-binding protein n=1 Tax=Ramlibacter montanisoli TaxID=2732512 RepID=A0A849KSC4_9BURK|nr:ATP-binding protein [Ramlibacter montanisoli]
MNHLIDFWPSLKAINDCIRTEAETADDAVLLAVHEPMPLKVREVGTGAEQARTEGELLDAFLAPADDGSAVVVAITGDSGVGKSHMIRWLHAQLQRHLQRDRLVIVLVPKTASLRQVVELMLAPLEGKEFGRLRQELGRATDTLNPETASRMLATALTIELKAREKQWIAELKAGNANDRSLRERALHARGLQTVLFQGRPSIIGSNRCCCGSLARHSMEAANHLRAIRGASCPGISQCPRISTSPQSPARPKSTSSICRVTTAPARRWRHGCCKTNWMLRSGASSASRRHWASARSRRS